MVTRKQWTAFVQQRQFDRDKLQRAFDSLNSRGPNHGRPGEDTAPKGEELRRQTDGLKKPIVSHRQRYLH